MAARGPDLLGPMVTAEWHVTSPWARYVGSQQGCRFRHTTQSNQNGLAGSRGQVPVPEREPALELGVHQWKGGGAREEGPCNAVVSV